MIKISNGLQRTVAELAKSISDNGNKVNLSRLAEGRNMKISSVRLKDGSTAKLLENRNEVDCIVMKNGRVLTAKGRFFKNPKEANEMSTKAMLKILNNSFDDEPVYFDYIA